MVDLRAYRPLGGIVHFNLFHMPPQPHTVKSWTITQRKSHLSKKSFDVMIQIQSTNLTFFARLEFIIFYFSILRYISCDINIQVP